MSRFTYDVWLDGMHLPMPYHVAGATLNHQCHISRAPVRGGVWRGLGGKCHQLGHVNLYRRGAARPVALYALQAAIQLTLAPTRNLHAPEAKLLADVFALQALSGQQYDLCAQSHPVAVELGAG